MVVNDHVARWGRKVLACGLFLVVAITLFPYDFSSVESVCGFDSRSFFSVAAPAGALAWVDFLANSLLFVPVGFGFASLVDAKRLVSVRVLTVVLISASLSLSAEFLQVMLVWRFPSINDVLANVLGALVGSISFSLWGPKWLGAVSILVKRGLEYFSTGKLILALVGYATMTFLLTILLQQTTALSNWEENLHLLVGNEPGGNRPWSGHVHELKIVNRAISEREVEMVFSENGLFHLGDPSLICSYRLSGGPSYVDQSEQLPDLVWRGSRREEQKGEMGSVGSDHWLETIEPVNWLSKRTKETSQFTLSARLTAVGESPVESYVVSLSRDPDHCNFVLAQAGAHLVFRLRTPLTGDNGRHPQLVVPDVFLEQKSRQLLVTYDGSQLWFYFDQPARQYSMELGPWLAFFRHIFPSNWSTPGDMAAFKALYYVMLFAPLGFIGALIGNPSRARSACGILFVSAAIALPPVVLEGILQATSGKFLSTDNLFLGMGVSCVAAFFSETLRRT